MRLSKAIWVAGLAGLIVAGSVGPAFAWTVGSKWDLVACTAGCGQQDYNNWCGVASTHAVLHNRGKNISQGTLASKYGVGKADGSAVAIEQMPGVLNSYVSGFDYVHVKRTDVTSPSLLASIVQYCTDYGYLGIPCVNPYAYTNSAGQTSPGLPTYSGTQRGGHYVVLRGYNYTSSAQTVYYWDPHYDASHYGYHATSSSTFWKCLNYKNWGSQGVVY
ncbi:MAG: hypothetical protein HGB10_04990 [Coriobacteriia bacterium]|nr:hypothetical protein [Coriobacteriia bacterium]